MLQSQRRGASDRAIKGEIAKGGIVIEPLNVDCIEPGSVDVRLNSKLRAFGPLLA
jgi:deoxycytidine triphosphate deaminase